MTIAWLAALAAVPAASAQAPPLENAIKATYLYKFAPFVEWPDAAAEFPGGSFTICVVGNDPLGDMLDRAVSGQAVGGHGIMVRRFGSVTANPGCAVMYVTGADPGVIGATLAAVRGTPVLTVTDATEAPPSGSVISFVIADGHVRFDIDNRAAETNGLTISSKLLSLAVHVLGRR